MAEVKPIVKGFFDPNTYTITYVVHHPETKDAVIIDPVWDYDPAASRLFTESIQKVFKYVEENNLKLHYVLETHAHADHITAATIVKQKYPHVKVVIGENIKKVQEIFKKIYNFDDSYKTDGSQFDKLIKDGEEIQAGALTIKAINTPGHTPACTTYVISDAVFTGDTIFMPDFGTGRCDFPGGSAETLYESITQRLYKLPDHYRLFVGHDYQPDGRPPAWETTIGDQKKFNIHISCETSKEQFVRFRTQRDAQLAAPKLLLPSIQINVFGGRLPKPESNGVSYLKIPIHA